MRLFFIAVSSLCCVTASVADQPVDFDRDVRPILSENCYFCHGPDASNRQADLRLDVRDDAIDAGAITPDDSESSELIARLNHEDSELLMPPPESHKTLTEKQKQTLTRWINEGAEYEPHWSFTPRVRPEVPTVEESWAHDGADGLPERPGDWIANPIDAFVLKELQANGVNPSRHASDDRLRRRVSLDLVGLPSLDEQSKANEIDYRQFIEQLFLSPHHGERMASGWLDVVRYADTVGFHGDQTQNIFPYRDWVIDSINDNVPFDQFTIAQLAGDLLPNPTTEDLVATGFNRLNMMTREGGAQPGEYLAKYAADRVRTVGMAWMGLTTGCAECHDHKFDPFSAKDFYSLAAYFDDVKQWGVYSDYGYTPNPELKGGNNDYPFYPEMEVFSEALLKQQNDVLQKMAKLAPATPKLEELANEFSSWAASHPTGWKATKASTVSGQSALGEHRSDGSITLTDPAAHDDEAKARKATVFTFDAKSLRSIDAQTRSIRIALHRASADSGSAMRDGANAPKLKFQFFAVNSSGERSELKVRRSDANRRHPDYSSTQPVLDITKQWKVPRHEPNGTVHSILDLERDQTKPLTAVFQFDEKNRLSQDDSLVVEIKGGKPSRVSFAVSPLLRLQPFDRAEVREIALADDLASGMALLHAAILQGNQNTRDRLKSLETELRRCRDGWAMTMVTQSMPPKTTRVLGRGNWQDESGEVVMPNPPAFIGTFNEPESNEGKTNQRSTRLDLARWIVHPSNPLTARVVVNRWWKHFFGTGLTASVDDVGAQGEPPSHPELLDWLASELVDSGWDRRHILRLIVNSNTYQQDSRVRTALRESDPDNRWLAYHPPRRLEAEAVRDHALAVAGLLKTNIGGPPVKPYQPQGYYANLQFPNRYYTADKGSDQYRRGIYMHWQRTFLHPMLANFDAPSREDCVAIRAAANTPQQALTLLNDPTFIEAARALAIKTLQEDSTDDSARIASMIKRVLQRNANATEVTNLAEFLDQQRNVYGDDSVAADDLMKIGQPQQLDIIEDLSLPERGQRTAIAEVAAWTATARVLLNTHESITRY